MSYFESKVNVFRGADIKNKDLSLEENYQSLLQCRQAISSVDLVPGDLIQIENNSIMPCDIILMTGQCVINEAMLTGESVPCIKSPLPTNTDYFKPQEESKQHTLFAGTKCLEARSLRQDNSLVLGLVYQTSFSTMKGQLVRSILYPKNIPFTFYTDSYKFIIYLSIFSVVCFMTTLKPQIQGYLNGYLELSELIWHQFDLITIVVPPALPISLQIGITIALGRLKYKKIFCISPQKINICGKIQIMCFDKTGTLTEEGMDLYGMLPLQDSLNQNNKVEFQKLVLSVDQLLQNIVDNKKQQSETNQYYNVAFLELMASCHGITSIQNQLIGDPLEIKMFEATKWTLDEQPNNNNRIIAIVNPKADDILTKQINSQQQQLLQPINIIRRFEFSSKLQRMSVIIQEKNTENKFRINVKGSPEQMFELCQKDSLPKNYNTILNFYAKQGYRLIAFGSKMLNQTYNDLQKLDRVQLEKDLKFLGFLIMENKIKPVTNSIIDHLQAASIRTILVSGDNILTAISVGRQCKMIKEDHKIFLGDFYSQNIDSGKSPIIWKIFDTPQKIITFEHLQINQNELLQVISQNDNQQQPQSQDNSFQLENQDEYSISAIIKQTQTEQDDKNNKLDKQLVLQNYNIEESEYNSQDLNQILSMNNNFSLAITGRAFSYMLQQSREEVEGQQKAKGNLTFLLKHAAIYARMKPEDKTALIQNLQMTAGNPCCGMCGDGANDCGALKTADIGISLSEAEASIAAPFTSKVQDISCVIKVLREGRAALVTSFQCFKYMVLYSMIQCFTVTICYFTLAEPGDFQFLYWDIGLVIPLSFLMGLTPACKKLSLLQPLNSLLTFPVIFSMIGQAVIQLIFQLGIIVILKKQNWYISCYDSHQYLQLDKDEDEGNIYQCFENTCLFWVSNFQYIIVAACFSIGKPWREPFYKNKWFSGSLILLIVLSIYIQLFSPKIIEDFFIIAKILKSEQGQDYIMPSYWPYFVLLYTFIGIVISYAYEKLLLPFATKKYNAIFHKEY